MRKTNKMGAQWAIIIGPEEQQQKKAVLKNMVNGKEETIPQTELVKKIK